MNSTRSRSKPIQDVLFDLTMSESRPWRLTEMAYGWCSVIYENHQSLEDWENLLLLSLETGFRHLDPQRRSIPIKLTHTKHHQKLVDVVFKSKDGEAIADLLHAWTVIGHSHEPAHILLDTCAGHLVNLHNQVHFSPRLRRLVTHSIGLIGYRGFKEVGVERFVELLNYLRVGVEDVDDKFKWMVLLLYTIQPSEGARHLSDRSWERLVELMISGLWCVGFGRATYSPQVMVSLMEAQEWGKLEYCVGVVWMAWPPETSKIEEDLECVMVLLFRQRPGAAQKLKGWVEQWSRECDEDMPESFQRVCKRAHEAAQRDALYAPFRTL